MYRSSRLSAFILTTLLGALPGVCAYAQTQTGVAVVASAELPDAPGAGMAGQQTAASQAEGNVSGVVEDANGAQVEGAQITLESGNSRIQRTMTTDYSGVFQFAGVAGGTFRVKVAAAGFAVWRSDELVLQAGQSYEMPEIVLHVASAKTDVDVIFTQHDLAEEQLKAEEKQRVLGVFPNFYVVYKWDAAPLSAGQKFRLALRTSVDPVSFVVPGIVAGVEQSQNDFSGYGQGAQGYAKRYGAAYGDGFIGTMIGGAILPSVLHQDPRYFYKGTGTVRERALYAISTVVICKGDNGKWQPNYSNILGNLAAAGISNAYYPASDRNGASLTIGNALLGTASGAIGSLIQEFFIKRITHGAQP